MDDVEVTERVGEQYVLRETQVRCVVEVLSVRRERGMVELEVRVLPSDLRAGIAVPEVGEVVSLAYSLGMKGFVFRLIPRAEYEKTARPRGASKRSRPGESDRTGANKP